MPIDESRIELAADLDSLARPGLDRLRRHNLAAMTAAALSRPAVRRRWPELTEVRDERDLSKLPVLSPGDLAAGCPPRGDGLLLAGSESGMVLRSSGTSGRRKTLYHSWSFTERVGFLGARGVRRALRDQPVRIANCLVPGELHGGFTFAHDVGRRLPALTFPVGTGLRMREVSELIRDHAVDTLMASPRYATELVTDFPAEHFRSLRSVLYLGAAIDAENVRAATTAVPGLLVRSLAYSTSETGPIGYQCPFLDDSTHHVHEDAVIVEIVDEATYTPVPGGTPGEIVVTPLTDTGMALFRYRIGDRGRLLDGDCPCGSAAGRLVLQGRARQVMGIGVWTISDDLLLAHLARVGVSRPEDCQLHVLWDGLHYRLRLLIATEAAVEPAPQEVAAALRESYEFWKITEDPHCTRMTVERLPRSEFAVTGTGKQPLFHQVGGPDTLTRQERR